MMHTQSFDLAQQWATEIAGEINVAQYWIPREGFRGATRGENWVALSRDGEEIYALALGDNPEIDPTWQSFSLPKSTLREKTEDLQLTGQWAAYFIKTEKCTAVAPVEIITNDEEITELLKVSAPDSSVYPGNPEIIAWGGIRNEAGLLVAVGALTQWQSGGKIISSIATHPDYRRQGFGRSLTGGLVRIAHERGFEEVVLAVFSKNSPARAMYESIGFTLLGDFNHFRR